MFSRAAVYYASILVTFLTKLPRSLLVVISEIGLRFFPKTELPCGIAIIDPSASTRSQFVKAVSEALKLVEEADPRRFSRLQRELGCVINLPVLGGAEYSRFLRTSRVDLNCFSAIADQEISTTLLACRFVSHATFGHICTRKLLAQRYYSRVKRVCFTEEARFARHLGLDLGEDWGVFGRDQLPASDQQRREWAKLQYARLKKRP